MTEAAAPANCADEIRRVVERYACAWAAGDMAAIADSYHADFVLHYFGRHRLAGVHVGKVAAMAALAEFSAATRRRLSGVLTVLSGVERGAILARETLKKGEETIEVDRLLLYAVRDGRLAECWVYDADQALIDACVGG